MARSRAGSPPEIYTPNAGAEPRYLAGRETEHEAFRGQLVADVTLLLDLREDSSEDSRRPFGYMQELPYCLSASRDRREILGTGCPDTCGWGPIQNRHLLTKRTLSAA